MDIVGVIMIILAILVTIGSNASKSAQKNQPPVQTAPPRPVPARPVTVVSSGSAGSAQPMQAMRMDSSEGMSTEGREFHTADFHSSDPTARLERGDLQQTDLGALRATQSVHTASNAAWKAPEQEAVRTFVSTAPHVTVHMLRQAIITKEILDAPLSRRQGKRR